MSYFVLRNHAYGSVDWTYRRQHVEDKGLTLEQLGQALDDPERLVIAPDPRSVTGESVRIIGYSEAAEEVLTVVVDPRPAGVRRHRMAGEQARVRPLSRNQVDMAREQMKDDLAAILENEVAAIEADPDPPDHDLATISRGNGRSKVLQVRVNPEELAALERLAEDRGLPTSTLAREAIIRLIRPEVARTASERRLIDAFAQYVTTLGVADSSTPE
jgi:hypothetical protein